MLLSSYCMSACNIPNEVERELYETALDGFEDWAAEYGLPTTPQALAAYLVELHGDGVEIGDLKFISEVVAVYLPDYHPERRPPCSASTSSAPSRPSRSPSAFSPRQDRRVPRPTSPAWSPTTGTLGSARPCTSTIRPTSSSSPSRPRHRAPRAFGSDRQMCPSLVSRNGVAAVVVHG